MRVGVIQSNYIPWRGYFDFIKSVDLFVFHDDLQYTKQDWRNRNKIKTATGTEWLTVPVKKAPTCAKIEEVLISGEEWKSEHCRKLREHLGKAPYFLEALQLWNTLPFLYLANLNRQIIRRVCSYLDIHTTLVVSDTLRLEGAKTDRLIDLMKKVGGKTYVSGPSAKGYLDVSAMEEEGFEVEWKTYDYPEYPQQYGGFEPHVTVLDLIANMGPEARKYI